LAALKPGLKRGDATLELLNEPLYLRDPILRCGLSNSQSLSHR
jgi:hypothetical protein